MTNTSARLSERLLSFADILVLSMLALTGEVDLRLFGGVAFLGVLRLSPLGRRVRFPNAVVVGLIVLMIAAALVAWLKYKVPLIDAATHAVPIVHAVLWWTRSEHRDRLLRLGVGFVELNLIAVLSSELFVPIGIFIFAVLSALILSCLYLMREQTQEVPADFLRNSSAVAFLTLLSSLILFPLLPRHDVNRGGGSGTQIGYAEEVRLERLGSLEGQGSGATVIRIYPKEMDSAPEHWIAHGLLRGRVLQRFDGERWLPTLQKRFVREELKMPRRPRPKNRMAFEMLREPLGTDIIPLPYGASDVEVANGYEWAPLARTRWDERSDLSRVYRRLKASFVIDDRLVAEADAGPVSTEDLFVPEKTRTPRMQKLAARLFKGVRTESEKIQRLRSFFSEERFAGSLNPKTSNPRPGYSPLEMFLFIDQEGHCEWFASSAAILLRMAGVPARVVAGFRVSSSSVGGVLSIRSGDAHAWTEAFLPGRGWVPIDLTPRVIVAPSLFLWARDTYDWLGGIWYRSVVSFDSKAQLQSLQATSERVRDWRKNSSFQLKLDSEWVFWTFALGVSLGVVLALGYVLGRVKNKPLWDESRRGGFKIQRLRLRWLRYRLERRTAKVSLGSPGRSASLDAAWEIYRTLRFGAVSDPKPHLSRLKQLLED